MPTRQLARIAGTVAACLVAGTAAAQELAPEGAFTINFTSFVVNGEPTIPIGPDREMGLYEGVLTASNAEGQGLLHNLTGRCMGVFEIDTSVGTFEQHGNCVYTDADGDAIWERFDFERQTLAPVQIASGSLDWRQREVRWAPRRVRDPRPPAATRQGRLRPGDRLQAGQLPDRAVSPATP